MRSLLAIVTLIAGALAGPVNGPQFILTNDEQEVTLQKPKIPEAFEHGHGTIETNQTIYMYLGQQSRYTKLVELIDFDEEYVTILNATTDKITFFAPDNKALTPPKKRKHDTTLSLATVYGEYERLQTNIRDEDDEEKKRRFKKILHALLQYHTLPAALDKPAMYTNVTYETAWRAKDGSYDGQQRRISVSNNLFGKLVINFYVSVEWVSVAAENGFIYGVERPIIPPPSILDELFFLSDFSILTSALQKVGLDDALQWRFKKSSETEGSGPVVSLFAPNNFAFKRLPPRLRLFLFSPAGEKALKKILQYHIVPAFILHSDRVHEASSDDDLMPQEDSEGEDWYTNSKTSSFPKSRTKEAKKMMRKWKKNMQKATSVISLLKDGLVAEIKGKEAPKLCLKNRRMRTYMEPTTNWPPHREHPNLTVNITIPTLLKDHSVRFVVAKHKTTSELADQEPQVSIWPHWIRSYVFVNGQGTGPEAVARNGAVYVLPRLLHPYKPNHDKDGDDKGQDGRWDDWEEWLPAWGEQ